MMMTIKTKTVTRTLSLSCLFLALTATSALGAETSGVTPALSVFTLQGQRVFVVVPPSIANGAPVTATTRAAATQAAGGTSTTQTATADLFVYYHGLHGYYRRAGKNNALTAVDLPAAVAASARPVIAILPEARRGDADRSRAWQRLITRAGGFERLIDASLAHVSATYSTPSLTVGRIAIAAHSGGGAMVGPSVAARGGRYGARVDEVTLMDAGYPYKRAFAQLKTWLLKGTHARTLRILHGGSAQAAYAVGLFSRDNTAPKHRSLRRYSGIRQEASAQSLTLTAQSLPAFTVNQLDFEVLELSRATDAASVSVEWGAALADGHYAIRDASLAPSVLAVGTKAPSWSLPGAKASITSDKAAAPDPR